MRLQMRLHSPAGLGRTYDPAWCIAWSEVRGGCEIRTREGLPPTHFPTLLSGVHQWPPPSVICLGNVLLAAAERFRTGVNETTFETARLGHDLWPCRLAAGFEFQCETGSMRSSSRSS